MGSVSSAQSFFDQGSALAITLKQVMEEDLHRSISDVKEIIIETVRFTDLYHVTVRFTDAMEYKKSFNTNWDLVS